MNLLQAIFLGFVQGATEFLPISSSAHLRLAPVAFNFADPGPGFDAVIQIGTVAAVLIYFWKDLAKAFMAWFGTLSGKGNSSTAEAKMGWAVFVGTLPVVVIGLAFRHQIKDPSYRTLYVVAGSMIVMAVIMYAAQLYGKKNRGLDSVAAQDGLLPGLLQCLAVIPGMSRSGSTITGAFLAGFDKEAATRFSFLMSVPSVLGAGLFELVEARHEITSNGIGIEATLIATLVAFVVGYASIKFLITWISKHGIGIFVVYRLFLGILLLILLQRGILQPMSGEDTAKPAASALRSSRVAFLSEKHP